jgi:hypothetical protein
VELKLKSFQVNRNREQGCGLSDFGSRMTDSGLRR